MKIRNGFVSNSSSSSFVVDKSMITAKQADQIKNHIKVSNDIFQSEFYDENDSWSIYEKDGYISGFTTMDSFDMSYFLKYIKIPNSAIRWDCD